MSDAIEKTAAGATRVLFGTVAFICLMVGIEGMTGAEKISVGLSALLIAAGAVCAYAAFFWEKAKKVLSNDTQDAIGKFSRSNATKASLLFAALTLMILSPFIEQHRWPFSYPIDPEVYAKVTDLENALNASKHSVSIEKDSADKWRFGHTLRLSPFACKYKLQFGPTARNNAALRDFWLEIFRSSGWIGDLNSMTNEAIPDGITLRVAGKQTDCAELIQGALNSIYPNPSAKIIPSQQSPYLAVCGDQCVQVEINY